MYQLNSGMLDSQVCLLSFCKSSPAATCKVFSRGTLQNLIRSSRSTSSFLTIVIRKIYICKLTHVSFVYCIVFNHSHWVSKNLSKGFWVLILWRQPAVKLEQIIWVSWIPDWISRFEWIISINLLPTWWVCNFRHHPCVA